MPSCIEASLRAVRHNDSKIMVCHFYQIVTFFFGEVIQTFHEISAVCSYFVNKLCVIGLYNR